MHSGLNRFAQRRLPHPSAAALTLFFLFTFASVGVAAPKGGKPTKPTISIASPSSGSTASGPVTVSGSASAGNTSLASVRVSLDGGSYQPASGTTAWSFPLNTASYPNGTHTIAAQATDSRGTTAVTTETVTFSNSAPQPPQPSPPSDTTLPSVSISAPAPSATVSGTVSVSGSASDNIGLATVQVSIDGGAYQAAQGTSGWSYSLDSTTLPDGSHTLAVRATDTSGNVSTTSEGVTVQNNSTNLPPGVVEQLVTPEGAKVQIYSGVTGWTAQGIYDLLKPNAYQLALIGPHLTIKVQTTYNTFTTTSAGTTGGVYKSFNATLYLDARSSSLLLTRPDATIAHEYGAVWSMYHLYLTEQGSWTPWLQARGLLGNPLVDSSDVWSKGEMIADDYRMLFGTPAAQSQMGYVNPAVPDPRAVTGLKDFFVEVWGA
jgi:Bacterial Ig domain